MKKLMLISYSTWLEKTKVRVGDKVIKLQEERELLGRLLIIQSSRPELVPKLEQTIGDYELATVTRSLCAVDGSLLIASDILMHVIEDLTPPAEGIPRPCNSSNDQKSIPQVLVVDAMA